MRFSAISSRGFSASAAILSRAAYIAAVNAARIRLSSQHFCPRPNNTARIVSDAGFSVPVPEPTTQPRTKAAKSIKKSVPKEKVRAQEETEVNVFNEPILRHRVSDDKLNPSPAIKRRRRNAKIVLVENNQIQTTTQATVIKWAEQIRNFVVEEYQSKTTVVEQEKQSQTIVVEQDEQIQTAVFGQQDPIKKEFRSQTAAFEHENQSQATIIGTEDQAINEISASIEFSSVASSMLPSFLDTLDLYSLPKVLTPAQRNIPVIICDSMDTLPQTLDACR
ncbi:hypothetical protein HK100_007775 [Physocladia obscura]|uniref:Uncharacterized protein n=1 Tax=Physocladia obscura TaxID=109957 RepID=A0AAD5X6Q5_9FUNG|nr:hypothetical protein HK100_007775 [Physocladia obscura]